MTIIMIALSMLSKADFINIKNVSAVGMEIIDENSVVSRVEKAISGSYMGLFSKRNIFLFPERSITREVKKDFPAIKKINIEVRDRQSISINLEERKPKFLFCSYELVEERPKLSKDCYFVDNEGLIFMKAPTFSGNAYFAFHGQNKDPIGQNISSLISLIEFEKFRQSVEASGFKSLSLIIRDNGDYELMLNPAGKIFFNNKESFEDFLLRLETFLGNLAPNIAATKTDFISRLDYIDFRFGNKVVYRLKESRN